MGNSSSSSRPHDDTVDYGFLTPQGVYTGTRDWNQQIVTQLIIERRLAPFYRPLEDYDESWDDEQILAARKELPESATSDSPPRPDGVASPARPGSISSSRSRPNSLKEPIRIPEAAVYRGAVECPICFLYYPPNINHSRCCDQAICTECFVQIKRAEPTTTHIVSEPAACPYCVQDNFGVTYNPPQWRAGIGADNSHSPIHPSSSRTSSQQTTDSTNGKNKQRRKSFGADSAEVVTVDHIRPDWEAKLAAVRAAVARRANRRIIMRQVGDRLIPVGVTSGRIHPLTAGEVPAGDEHSGDAANVNEGRGSRRSRRRQQQQQQSQDLNQLLGTMGLGGQDLEELMVMEAMRLSLLEHEEQQRKEAEEKRKKEEKERASNGGGTSGSRGGESEAGPSTSGARLELPPIPLTSPIEVTGSSRRDLSAGLTSGSSPGSPSPGSFAGRTPGSASSSPNPSDVLSTSVNARPHASTVPSPLGNASGTSPASVVVAKPVVSGSHSRSPSQVQTLENPESRPETVTPVAPALASSLATRTEHSQTPSPALPSISSAALYTHGAASTVLSASGTQASEAQEAAAVRPSGKQVAVLESSNGPVVGSASSRGAPPSPPPKETLVPLHIVTESTTPTPEGVSAAKTMLAPPNDDSSTSMSLHGGETSRSYDELPSSPESTFSHRPLLLETPTVESADPDEQIPYERRPDSQRTDSLFSL